MEHGFSIVGCDTEMVTRLLEIFERFPNYHNVGICDQYSLAMDHILKQGPHLVLINVDREYAEGNSFHFVNELAQYLDHLPLFIAISKTKEKAYEVIKSNFIDYLLMPFSEFELRRCILKMEKNYNTKHQNKFCLKSYSDYRFIDLDKIIYLAADNNTTDFFVLEQGKIPAYKTLKHYQNLLPDNFLRIHNSYLINTHFLNRINFGKCMVTLNGEQKEIPFSRSYKSEIEYLRQTLSEVYSIYS